MVREDLGVTKSPKLPSDVTLMSTHYLKGTESLLMFAKRYWDFDWDRAYWQQTLKVGLVLTILRIAWSPLVQHGEGSVMLWGCFSSKCPGSLVRVHGIMDSMKYQDILNQNLAASAKKIKLGRHWIFQLNNDPKHMSRSTQHIY